MVWSRLGDEARLSRPEKLAIDEDVLKEEMFGCHPCENTSSIRFKTRDLMEKILPALNITPTIVHLVGTE